MIEGENLVLLCSVAEGIGNITFSWHREATGISLGKKTQHFLSAELQIPTAKECEAGQFYFRADNNHDPIQSTVVNIPVRRELHAHSSQTEIPKPRSQCPGVKKKFQQLPEISAVEKQQQFEGGLLF